MTIDVVRANPSSLRQVFTKVRHAIERPTDRTILIALFASLFFLNYVAQLFDLSAGERLIFSTSRTVSGAQIIGFIAIAVVLKDLRADIVLRWFDLATIFAIAVATLHPWRSIGALAFSILGILFICRSDKRLRSLGQLCLGLAWIDFWGPVVMGLINQWLLPIETALAKLPCPSSAHSRLPAMLSWARMVTTYLSSSLVQHFAIPSPWRSFGYHL